MLREIRILTKLFLGNPFGVNVFKHTRDKKEKKRYIAISGVIAFVLLMGLSYVTGLSYGFIFLGLGDILILYLGSLASLVILFIGIFKAGDILYSDKGYDILASLPLKRSSIMISKYTKLYSADLICTLFCMIPGGIVYALFGEEDVAFFPMLLLVCILMPLIPLSISVIFGTLVYAISSRMKRKVLWETVLILFFLFFTLILSFNAGSLENMSPEYIKDLLEEAGGTISNMYPPSQWISGALKGDFTDFILLFAVSAAFLLLSVFLSSMVKIVKASGKGEKYSEKALKKRSFLRSMIIREFKRYFSSSVYVTNTIVGPIMGLIMSAAVLIFGTEKIMSFLPFEINLVLILPFALSAVFTMMPPASVSISMEGKNIWILKALPVSMKDVLLSKLMMNGILSSPFYFVSEILLTIAFKPSFSELLILWLIPVSIMLLTFIIGLSVNIKIHSFTWENETYFVKQSVPAAIGGFSGLFISVLSGGTVFLMPTAYAFTAALMLFVIFTAVSFAVFKMSSEISVEAL